MRLNHIPVSVPARFLRAIASIAAGLVLLLSLSAVSPELHAWLHEHEEEHTAQTSAHPCEHASNSGVPVSDSDDREVHQCAVTIFSQGVLSHAVALVMQPCEGILRAVNFRAFEQLALAQPRFLHLPPQAPPAV
jgi:hypothetical protein